MEETLGKRIVQHRKQLGLTQDQLAERLGVTAQAVSKWENDQSCPDITMLPKLAEIFSTTTDALLGHETPPVCQAEVVETSPGEEAEKGFEFHWDGGRKHALGYAVLVLMVGVLTLLSNVLGWSASFWEILWPSFLLMFGLLGLYPRFSFFRLGCTLFGTYFLLDNLGAIPFTVGGDVIFPTLLILFGLSLLGDAFRKPKKPTFHCSTKGHKNKANFTAGDERFTFSGSFGESEQFVELPRLSEGEINISFGDFTVDLSGVQAVSSNCTLSLNCSFGELTLLVPRCYQVQPQNHTAFAQIHTCGHPSDSPTGVIHVEASASFGEIHIKYV